MTTADEIQSRNGQLKRNDELTETSDDDHYVNVMTAPVGNDSHFGTEVPAASCQDGYLEPNDLRRKHIMALVALENPGKFCRNQMLNIHYYHDDSNGLKTIRLVVISCLMSLESNTRAGRSVNKQIISFVCFFF
jgi:hypothetical protein